jgi:hypothetical protein
MLITVWKPVENPTKYVNKEEKPAESVLGRQQVKDLSTVLSTGVYTTYKGVVFYCCKAS